jgi:ribosomal protein S12 methylthiotransferase accessory factor
MDPVDAPVIGFKSHLRAETIPGDPGDAVCLISARGTTVLSGSAAPVLAELLDGTRSLAEVVRDASPRLAASQVGLVLGRLAAANLIGCRGSLPPPGADPVAAYWDLAGLDGHRIARARPGAAVEIVTLADVDADAAMAACRSSGLAVHPAGDRRPAFSLVLCQDYLAPELAAVNERCLAAERPWLLAKPGGPDPWIGPVFQPGTGPCWACLAERLRRHRRVDSLLSPAPPGGPRMLPPEASLPACGALGLQLAVLETAKWLAGFRHDGQGAVWILDTLTLAGRHHPVTRSPQCPACGDPALVAVRTDQPVVLRSRPRPVAGGDGDRCLSAEATLARYGHLVDPVTGITAEIRRDPRSPSPLHCCRSGANLAVTGDTLAAIRAGARMQSGGAGCTPAAARASALCEAVERYCGSRFGDERTVRASYRDLRERAIHPDSCQLFHERQFQDRTRWNATGLPFQRVFEPFDELAKIDWTPVWSLTERRHRLLPTAMLYFQPDAADGSASVYADSNGCAAGGSLEEAVVQGFLELVERDAVALWWYNRTRQAVVDVRSFDDPWVTDLHTAYDRMGRQTWVLDVTSDLGIPAMAAVSRRVGEPTEHIVLGFGAHFDPRVAVRRAMTELGQLMPAASPVGGEAPPDPALRDWWASATVDNQPYLRPDPGQAARSLDSYRYAPRPDVLDDIEHICALARWHGLDVLVLDQTRPDIGLPVVKVVVPGLRHFWARFAPGRLYDVPVRLGRLAAPKAFEQLNPVPLFLLPGLVLLFRISTPAGHAVRTGPVRTGPPKCALTLGAYVARH